MMNPRKDFSFRQMADQTPPPDNLRKLIGEEIQREQQYMKFSQETTKGFQEYFQRLFTLTLWSIGVILGLLITGATIFSIKTVNDVTESAKQTARDTVNAQLPSLRKEVEDRVNKELDQANIHQIAVDVMKGKTGKALDDAIKVEVDKRMPFIRQQIETEISRRLSSTIHNTVISRLVDEAKADKWEAYEELRKLVESKSGYSSSDKAVAQRGMKDAETNADISTELPNVESKTRDEAIRRLGSANLGDRWGAVTYLSMRQPQDKNVVRYYVDRILNDPSMKIRLACIIRLRQVVPTLDINSYLDVEAVRKWWNENKSNYPQ